MDIYILNEELQREHIIRKYQSLTWNTAFQESGNFELKVGYDLFKLFMDWEDLDKTIFIENTDDDWHVGVVEVVEKIEEEEGEKYISVKGRTAEGALLNRRVPEYTLAFEDKYAPEILADIFNDTFISPLNVDRKIPQLVYKSQALQIGEKVTIECGNDDYIYEHAKKIISDAQIGFRASLVRNENMTDTKIEIIPYEGVDRSLHNDPADGNDRIVVGQRRGTAQRIEFYSDITTKGTAIIGRMSSEEIGSTGKTLLWPNGKVYCNHLGRLPDGAITEGATYEKTSGIYFNNLALEVTGEVPGFGIPDGLIEEIVPYYGYNLIDSAYIKKKPLDTDITGSFEFSVECVGKMSGVETKQTETVFILVDEAKTNFIALACIYYHNRILVGVFRRGTVGGTSSQTYTLPTEAHTEDFIKIKARKIKSGNIELIVVANGKEHGTIWTDNTRNFINLNTLYIASGKPNTSTKSLTKMQMKNIKVQQIDNLGGGTGLRRFEKPFDLSNLSRTYEDENGVEWNLSEENVEKNGEGLMTAYLGKTKPKMYVTGKLPVTMQRQFRKKFNLGDIVTVVDDETGFTVDSTVLNAQETYSIEGHSVNIDIGERSPITDEEEV